MDEVQEDKRKAYQASESLPDLEVPPDLILEAAPDAFHVDVPAAGTPESPPVADTPAADTPESSPVADTPVATAPASPPVAATRPTADPPVATAPVSPPVAATRPTAGPTGQEALLNSLEVAAGASRLWPWLIDFFIGKGWELLVSDEELGVIETAWSAPYFQNGETVRDRFKVFMETASPASTQLVLTSEKEIFRQSDAGSADGSWIVADQAAMDNYNRGTIKEMEVFFREKMALSGEETDSLSL